ncbi:MAG: hypothetical protein KDA41_08485, partial [Planctomycetales bacterium]|nr:hypothetical protein [Planctomycetales bacterium]
GGSILGDKTRMPRLAAHENCYIRPSPAAGTLGGVARKTRENMLLCEAAGFDVVLIETVGVGQSETMVANMTDCFVALAMPGAGDELQGIKRGLLELVNVIVVNKADGPSQAAADVAAHQYRQALSSLSGSRGEAPQVFTCSALEDRGVAQVWNAVADRQMRLRAENKLEEIRRRQSLRWLWSTVEDRLRQDVAANPRVSAIRHDLERDVLEGRLPPETAARRIFEAYKTGGAPHGDGPRTS